MLPPSASTYPVNHLPNINNLEISESTRDAALARIFSRRVFRELSGEASSPLLHRLSYLAGIGSSCDTPHTNAEIFEIAYRKLKKPGSRNAYVYKNALLTKRLRRSSNSSNFAIVDEMRVGTSVADLMVFSNQSHIYEIKSERDSFDRIRGQLRQYFCASPLVSLVIPSIHLKKVLGEAPESCGVIELTDHYTLRTHRQAKYDGARLEPDTICSILRIEELKQLWGTLLSESIPPHDMHLRARLTTGLSMVDVRLLHHSATQILRRTRANADSLNFAWSLPRPLQYLGMSATLSPEGRIRLLVNLDRRLI